MRFLFLNQYGPPDPVPTARLLGELADHLRAAGHEVTIISQKKSYQGRPARGGGRLRREMEALLAIGREALWGGHPRPDVILALSSPPGLLVVAAFVAIWRRARLAEWAMDLYPELAVALAEGGPGIVYRIVGIAMQWAYRRADLVIALDTDMRDHLQRTYGIRAQVQEPWPSPQAMQQTNLGATDPSLPWTWLYSGNLGRAHDWRTMLDAQNLLEKRGLPVQLVVQGDGASRPPAQAYAEELGLNCCVWKDYVAEADLVPTLLRAQALIVTQRPETQGLLWPSKLALLERLPRRILFIGPRDGAIAERLLRRGNAGAFAPGESGAVADWITAEYQRTTGRPPCTTLASSSSAEACARIERWLERG